jgi:hypothetical protein
MNSDACLAARTSGDVSPIRVCSSRNRASAAIEGDDLPVEHRRLRPDPGLGRRRPRVRGRDIVAIPGEELHAVGPSVSYAIA